MTGFSRTTVRSLTLLTSGSKENSWSVERFVDGWDERPTQSGRHAEHMRFMVVHSTGDC